MTKKKPEKIGQFTIIPRAKDKVRAGLAFQFAELIQKFEWNLSIHGRSSCTFKNYSRHLSQLVYTPTENTTSIYWLATLQTLMMQQFRRRSIRASKVAKSPIPYLRS